MDIVDYHVDIYGAFSGRLNRADIPSDRFSTSWDLKRSVHRPEYDLESLLQQRRTVTDVEPAVVEGKSGPVELEMLRGVDWDLDEDLLLVEIPFDFYKMSGRPTGRQPRPEASPTLEVEDSEPSGALGRAIAWLTSTFGA
jgi:hypothetical protein